MSAGSSLNTFWTKNEKVLKIVIGVLVVAGIFYYAKTYYGQREGFNTDSPKKIILFYSPGCPHCKPLIGHGQPDPSKPWDQLTSKYSGNNNIKVEAVDCEEKPEVANQLGIGGFPTIMLFKDGKSPVTYDGDRSFNSIEQFLISS